jgi:hypothetical protein
MNEFLADLYGTREQIGASNSSDVEKLAEAQVLDQVFKSEGIDVDKLPDEAIVKVAYELFGQDSAIVKAAEGEKDAEGEEEHEEEETPAEEKKEEEAKKEASEEEKTAADLEKADFLGRVMAHSFVQERGIIEKTAKKEEPVRAGKLETALGKGSLHGVAGAAGGAGAGAGLGALAGKALKRGAGKGALVGAGLGYGAGALGGQIHGLVKGWQKAKKINKELDKKSSALDVLAEKRAMEILKEAGMGPKANEEEKLAQAVEQRALEMLQEAGYVTE